MADCISRKLLKKELLEQCVLIPNGKTMSIEDAMCVIDNLPSAEERCFYRISTRKTYCGECQFRKSNGRCSRTGFYTLDFDYCSYAKTLEG